MLALDERLKQLQEAETKRQADLKKGTIRIVPARPSDSTRTEQQEPKKQPA